MYIYIYTDKIASMLDTSYSALSPFNYVIMLRARFIPIVYVYHRYC